MKKFATFFVFLVIFAMTSVTMSAGTISQLWSVDTNGVDKIEIFPVSPPSGFANPALTGLPGGWVGSTVNPGYVLATGPAVPSGTLYTINMDTPVNDPLVMDILEWNGNIVQEHLRFFYKPVVTTGFTDQFGDWYWNKGPNGSFVDPQLGGMEYNRTPEPATCALMGAGLVALGALHRRRRQQIT